jgi:hypothetical protein
MYQGGQAWLRSADGKKCASKIALAMGQAFFCYAAAPDGALWCAGSFGLPGLGTSFAPAGVSDVVQAIAFEDDEGICVRTGGGSILCLGEVHGMGPSRRPPGWFEWGATLGQTWAAIATGTGHQMCALSRNGAVYCAGVNFSKTPVLKGAAQAMWVNSFGEVVLDDPKVLRPGEGHAAVMVEVEGLSVSGAFYGPPGGVVQGGDFDGVADADRQACWLTDAGDLRCSEAPDTRYFASGIVVAFTGNWESNELCAVHHDGSLWCLGANSSGKLGTGTKSPVTRETRVAPPGTVRIDCQF